MKCAIYLLKVAVNETSVSFSLIRTTFTKHRNVNAKNLLLLKNVRDKIQFLYLTRQVYPENSDSLEHIDMRFDKLTVIYC